MRPPRPRPARAVRRSADRPRAAARRRAGSPARLVKRSAPHLEAASIVAPCPVEELDVRLVELAAGRDGLATVTLDLTGPQARQTDVRRDDEEDDQLELGDERISPATERPRDDPGRGPGQRGPELRQPGVTRPRTLVGGIGRKPVEVVGVQMAVPVPGGQCRRERRRAAARGAEDVDPIRHPQCRRSFSAQAPSVRRGRSRWRSGCYGRWDGSGRAGRRPGARAGCPRSGRGSTRPP